MAGVIYSGVRATDGRKVQLTAADNPENTAGGSINANELGAANGIATLDGSSLVVQNPASTDGAANPNTIPLRDGNGDVIVPTTPTAVGGAASKSYIDNLVTQIPRWYKTTVAATAFTAAATTEDIELISLPAGGVIQGIKIKHSTAFSGGTLSALTLSVGITGTLDKYSSAFDVFQAVANTTFQVSNSFGSENHGAVTSIRLAASATGDTLDNVGTGSVDVWVLYSVAV